MTPDRLATIIGSQDKRIVDCSIEQILYWSDDALAKLSSINEISSWHEMHLMNGLHFYVHKLLPHKINGHDVFVGLAFSVNDLLETKLIVRECNSSLYIWQIDLNFCKN